MPQQTIIWTVIPNGVDRSEGDERLKLSVFVSPRLERSDGDPILLQLKDLHDDFDDFRHWPSVVQNSKFKLVFPDQPPVDAKLAPGLELQEDFWEQLFPDTTTIKLYEFTDLSQNLISSYSMKSIHDHLKNLYSPLALEHQQILTRGILKE